MSVIGVKVEENKITMISDSQFSYCDQAYPDDKKIFEEGRLMIGFAGETIKREFFYQPDVPLLVNVRTVLKFWNVVKDRLEDSGLEFTDHDSVLLVDKKTFKAFYLHCKNLTCFEVKDVEFIGAGANYALGAYHGHKNLHKAIRVACKLNIYCSEPILYLGVTK